MANKITKFKYNFKKNYWYDLFWSYKSKILWTWLDIEDISKYNFWDNVKYINWKITAKKNELYVNKFVEEKSLKVDFFIDVSSSMNFWSTQTSKIDLLFEIYYILTECWINNWDILNWYFFDEDVIKIDNKISKNLFTLTLKLAENLSFNKNKNFNNLLEYINKIKLKNNVIFILTDEIDLLNYINLLKQVWIKNKVIIINMFDFLEVNSYKNLNFNIWKNTYFLNSPKKINTKLCENKKLLIKNNIDNLVLDTKSDIYKEIYKYFTSKIL